MGGSSSLVRELLLWVLVPASGTELKGPPLFICMCLWWLFLGLSFLLFSLLSLIVVFQVLWEKGGWGGGQK